MIKFLVLKVLVLSFVTSQCFAAETVLINDFVLHIRNSINSTSNTSELYAKLPGSLEERTSLIKKLRLNKTDQLRVPKATLLDTVITLEGSPSVKIDFAELNSGNISVNGVKIEINGKNPINDQIQRAIETSNKKFSLIELIINPAYALDFASKAIQALKSAVGVDTQRSMRKSAESIKSGSEAAVVYAVTKYTNCKDGMEECPFYSPAENIKERLTYGEYRGISKFVCENGEMKQFQALKVEKDKNQMPPLFDFNSDKNGITLVSVKEFDKSGKESSTCQFEFDQKTKQLSSKSSIKTNCKLRSVKYLASLNTELPLDSASSCCKGSQCIAKIESFKKGFVADQSDFQLKSGSKHGVR